MDAAWTAGVAALGLAVLLALGVPVGVAMGLVGAAGMWLVLGPTLAIGQLKSLPFAVVNDFSLAVLPMFVLMGVLAEASGLTWALFRAAELWLRGVRGGLYQAVVAGSALFAALSGSTTVNALVFTRIALPKMTHLGYSVSLSLGCIAGAGSFAAMIPPSLTMVIYAVMTEQSVGQLLLAGVIPGLLTAAAYMLGLSGLVRLRPDLAPRRECAPSLRERVDAAKPVMPLAALGVLVLGGIYNGWFPPAAAGAVGAGGALVLAVVQQRGVRGWLVPGLREAAALSCILFVVLIGGLVFSRFLAATGAVSAVVGGVTDVAQIPLAFVVLTALVLLVLGALVDTTSMMVIVLPFLFPAAQALNIDPIWFGIVVVKLVEISVITPPVGINLFAVMGAASTRAGTFDLYKGVLPFIVLDLLVLGAVVAWPSLATWLPNRAIAGG